MLKINIILAAIFLIILFPIQSAAQWVTTASGSPIPQPDGSTINVTHESNAATGETRRTETKTSKDGKTTETNGVTKDAAGKITSRTKRVTVIKEGPVHKTVTTTDEEWETVFVPPPPKERKKKKTETITTLKKDKDGKWQHWRYSEIRIDYHPDGSRTVHRKSTDENGKDLFKPQRQDYPAVAEIDPVLMEGAEKDFMVTLPNVASTGSVIGGNVGVEGAITVGTVVVETEDGQTVDVPVEPDGKFVVPAGFVMAGIAIFKFLDNDGMEVQTSSVSIEPKYITDESPEIVDWPKILPLGGNGTITGQNLAGGFSEPLIIIKTAGLDLYESPAAYSDREIKFAMPDGLESGVGSIQVFDGSAELSEEMETNFVNVSIHAPTTLRVGQDFTSVVKIEGLTNSNKNLDLMAIVEATGPIALDGQNCPCKLEVPVVNGEAQIPALTTRVGNFEIKVKEIYIEK